MIAPFASPLRPSLFLPALVTLAALTTVAWPPRWLNATAAFVAGPPT